MKYQIEARRTGIDLGTYEGDDELAAAEAMWTDARVDYDEPMKAHLLDGLTFTEIEE